MSEILTNLSKVLPQLFILAAVFGFIGWSLRGLSVKPAPVKPGKPAAPEKNQGVERAKNLEASLEKARASHKALKSEFDQHKAGSVSKEELEAVTAELESARKSLESESRRASATEADLKKLQETNKSLNARATDSDKTQKDRHFALENELSKAREQLALLQNRPDDSSGLQAEIERLRESVATTTRFSGEVRKREAAALEALEKAEARLATALENGGNVPPPVRKIGPVADSGRIAAAKAEVLRLVEKNKQRETAPAPASISPEPAPASVAPAAPAPAPLLDTPRVEAIPDVPVILEEPAPIIEESAPIIEEPAVAHETSESAQVVAEKKTPPVGDLFPMD